MAEGPGGSASLCNRDWVDMGKDVTDAALARLCEELAVSEVLGRILAARRLGEVDEARRFLHPDETQLHPPHLMLGMAEGVGRIYAALQNYEKILIFGDYDVDGTAAATILYSYLKKLGGRVHYFIPNRLTDGYGLNAGSVEKFKAWGVELVITADHGSTAVEGARALAQRGIELIVTDHHQIGRTNPECVAIINPHRPGCPYPFKQLSAAGVAFKVISALDQFLEEVDFWDLRGIRRTPPSYFLDLVAMATVADMSPLVGENRVLVKLGLDAINARPRPGISGLIRECNIRGPITPTTISFKLAPKINAVGRIGDPRLGVQLFTSHSFTESRKIARFLVETNRERKVIEQEVFGHALKQLARFRDEPACVLVGGDWHPGVVGPIASRMAFQTGKPTVALTLWRSPEATGSARSGEGFDVLDALAACESLLHRFGGHPKAAGLSLHPDNLDAFTRSFYDAVGRGAGEHGQAKHRELRIDAWVTPAMLNSETFEELARLSPFGFGNPEPVLAMRRITVDKTAWHHSRHLRLDLRGPMGREMEGMAWDSPDLEVATGRSYDVAFVPRFLGRPAGSPPQLKVLDFLPCA